MINYGTIPFIYIHLWPSHLPFAYQFIFTMMTYKTAMPWDISVHSILLLSFSSYSFSKMTEDCRSLKKELFISTDVTKKVQTLTHKYEVWILPIFTLQIFPMMIKKIKKGKLTVIYTVLTIISSRARHLDSLRNQETDRENYRKKKLT